MFAVLNVFPVLSLDQLSFWKSDFLSKFYTTVNFFFFEGVGVDLSHQSPPSP